jgi:hypothetical protein
MSSTTVINLYKAIINSIGNLFFLKIVKKFDIFIILILGLCLLGGDTRAVKTFIDSDSFVVSEGLFYKEIIPLNDFTKNNLPATAIVSALGTKSIFLKNNGSIRDDISTSVVGNSRASFLFNPFTDKNILNREPKISELVPAPQNPEKQNFLFYPRFNVSANIIHLNKEDYDIVYKGEPCSYRSMNTPLQRRVKEGILHLYGSPMPGDIKYNDDPLHLTYDESGKKYEEIIGSSYIVGHSSECTEHAYTRIFEPLQEKSSIGDEFFIYDQEGRKLRFVVFKVERIIDTDTNTAYQKYTEGRVVTLQTSIYYNKNNIQRWLTVGKLEL